MTTNKLSHVEANVVYRVLARIHQLALSEMEKGDMRNGRALSQMAGALEERIMPYAHSHEDNPLSEPRCAECHHFVFEHENGRCTRFSTHGYQRDTVCQCSGWRDAA